MAETDKAARRIVILAFAGVEALDVVGPLAVLAEAVNAAPGSYDLAVVGPEPLITTSSGLVLGAQPLPGDELEALDTLIVTGAGREALTKLLQDQALLDWVRRTAAKAKRQASVCTGALVLAAIGALKGRRATTHWLALDQLKAIEPAVILDRHALYTEDGPVWTSAGIASGIDLALALVRRDLGPEVAIDVARNMVVPVVRPGTQSMFAAPFGRDAQQGDLLTKVLPHIAENLAGDLSTPALADAVGMTPRTFHRRCKERFGMTPAQLVNEVRLDQARALLLNDRAPLKRIAAEVGFADAASFSVAFQRHYRVSPSAFRHGFGVPG